MTEPRRRLGAAGAILLVSVLLITVFMPIGPSATGASTASDSGATTLRFEAPNNLTGTFVGSLVLETDTPASCDHREIASGRYSSDNPVGFWARVSTPSNTTTGLSFRTSIQVAQAHAGDDVDTRDVTPDIQEWRRNYTFEWGVEDRLVYTVAGFGLQRLPGDSPDRAPLTVEVTCPDHVEIAALYASRSGRSFDQGSLEGGVGASTDLPTGPRIARDDHLAHRFETDKVRFQAAIEHESPTTQGDLSLRHPNGTQIWEVPNDGPAWVGFDGEPGDYDLGLNWTSVGGPQDLDYAIGVLVGLDRVDSWDEAL